jgi:hypothetical protein
VARVVAGNSGAIDARKTRITKVLDRKPPSGGFLLPAVLYSKEFRHLQGLVFCFLRRR